MDHLKQRYASILLIEDNKGDARLLLELLKDSNFNAEVDVVEGGTEALEYLREAVQEGRHPDIIILDLKLPGMSGHQLLERIKSNASLRFIPVIVLSSSNDEADIIKSYDLQASCYIIKPSDLSHYEEAIKIIETFWFELVKLPA